MAAGNRRQNPLRMFPARVCRKGKKGQLVTPSWPRPTCNYLHGAKTHDPSRGGSCIGPESGDRFGKNRCSNKEIEQQDLFHRCIRCFRSRCEPRRWVSDAVECWMMWRRRRLLILNAAACTDPHPTHAIYSCRVEWCRYPLNPETYLTIHIFLYCIVSVCRLTNLALGGAEISSVRASDPKVGTGFGKIRCSNKERERERQRLDPAIPFIFSP